MDFDYDSLVALEAVVREGGFEAAANALNVTQSAVSQRIKQLEKRVGTPLIIRGRPCVPTDTGMHLCRHLEQVTLLQHELNGRIRSLLQGPDSSKPTIRLAINSDSLATWFPAVLKRAAEELNVRIEVIPDDQEHTEQRLKSGDALAVITAIEKPVQGCRRISLGAMEYMAVASKELFAKQFADGVSLKALGGAPCIAFDRKDTLPAQWMMLCFGEAAEPLTHLMPSYEGYLSCCLNGSGWGLMPAVTVLPHVKSGKLVEIIPDKRIKMSLHWQSSTQSSEILRLLGKVVSDEALLHLTSDGFRAW